MSEHSWYYRSDPIVGDAESLGPFRESELIGLAGDGKLKRDTLIASQTRTSGKWIATKQVPQLLLAIETGENERQQRREVELAEKRQRTEAATAVERARQEQLRAARASEVQEIAAISHCQNIELVKSLREKVSGILTSSETIIHIAVQQKPLVNIAPDAVIATNRRLIFYRAKMLGRFEFQDFQWFDVHNAHIQQNLLGAVFTCRHSSGRVLSLDYLPKEAAQALYRLAQETEERARVARHELHLDTLRAGATNVNVGQPQAAPVMAQLTPSVDIGNDIVKRLETLKSMLDKGLITSDDFERRKQEILSQV